MRSLLRELHAFDHTERDDDSAPLLTRRRPRPSDRGGRVSSVAWAAALVAGALIGTNHALELIPLVAICAPVVLLWHPISSWTRRSEVNQTPRDDPALEQRVELLEKQLDASLKQQSQLQDMLHWQERLLHRTTGESPLPDQPRSGRL